MRLNGSEISLQFTLTQNFILHVNSCFQTMLCGPTVVLRKSDCTCSSEKSEIYEIPIKLNATWAIPPNADN